MADACIGVFDSGFGGLTVLRELRQAIPDSDYLYFGDTARLPYGSKSADTVARYAVEAAHFLQQHGATTLVVACNTATALALPQIEAAVSIPVIGVIEPGAEQARAATRRGKVVVVATEATVSSHAYLGALERRGAAAREKACPLLVPLVEEGWIEHPVTEQVASIYLEQAFADGFEDADVLLLGCTHYPLIRSVLARVVPVGVKIVDSAHSTAQAVKLLTKEKARNSLQSSAARFFVTDSTEKFRRLGARFLGEDISEVQHVDLRE